MDSERSFARRNKLLEIEAQARQLWEENEVFQAEAKAEPSKEGEKFFGNFLLPYMNGNLHLGHGFSQSKLEFAAAYHRLRGANVLLPFGFHCIGMPIKSLADKLSREVKKFGYPPDFSVARMEEKKPEEEKKLRRKLRVRLISLRVRSQKLCQKQVVISSPIPFAIWRIDIVGPFSNDGKAPISHYCN